MAVKRRVPLCLGLAAAGLVLSTSSGAFVGLPSSKVPSESGRQLRGQASVRMALNANEFDLTPDAEAEEVSMGQIARASLAMLAALIVAVLPVADAHAGIGGKAPPTPAAAPPPPPPAKKPLTARSAVAPAAPVRAPPPPPARPLPPPPPPARSAPPPPPPSRAAPPPPEKVTIIEKNTTIIQAAPPAPVAVAPPPGPGLGEMVAGAAVQGIVGGMVSGAVQSAMSGGGGGGGSAGAPAGGMLEGQLRQDERQLDKQAMEIENIKMMLQAEMAKK